MARPARSASMTALRPSMISFWIPLSLSMAKYSNIYLYSYQYNTR